MVILVTIVTMATFVTKVTLVSKVTNIMRTKVFTLRTSSMLNVKVGGTYIYIHTTVILKVKTS